jgi:hypothetical protein
MSAGRLGVCGECGSSLADGQRYCLACGARAGERDAHLGVLLQRGHRADQAPPPVGVGAESASPPRSRGAAVVVPRTRTWAALTLGFLAFGALLGGAAGGSAPTSLASARAPVRLVLPTTQASSSSNAPSPAEASPPAGEEPPSSEATPTPTATPAPAAKPTSTPSGSTPAAESAPASPEGGAGAPATKLPAVKHVFLVMLSDEPYASLFGPASPAHYLSQTLERRGALLVRYDAVAHEQLANEIALLSGQGPTQQTAANCPTYADISPTGRAASEQVLGSGCVYPPQTRTLVGQLAAKHLTARAYVEGIDEPGSALAGCAHPPAGQSDPTGAETAAYATFRNPFVYFHSITDSPACSSEDVGLAALPHDLALGSRAPSLSYIAPDRCHDGNPAPCAVGAPAGMAAADAFLRQWVPRILSSKAYKDGGLLVITADEAPSSGEFADSSSCCGEPARYPNLAAPPAGGPTGHGGGTVGALLLSPFISRASTSQQPYNHLSLLRTIEDLFGLSHLGYAALPAVKPLEASLFSASSP